MTISVAVMAHPKRRAMVVDELVPALLYANTGHHVEVVWDERNDRHDTGLRAIEAHDPDATHHLVIQDDALPCRDLVAGLARGLERCPGPGPWCLYAGRVRPFARLIRQALAGAAGPVSWLTMPGIYWGPAIVYPAADLAELVPWYRQSRVTNYDRRVSTFYAERGATVWYPWPSLVDHRPGESLNGHGSGRVAHTHVGADFSALAVDWSGEAVPVLGTERADAARQRAARTRV